MTGLITLLISPPKGLPQLCIGLQSQIYFINMSHGPPSMSSSTMRDLLPMCFQEKLLLRKAITSEFTAPAEGSVSGLGNRG